MAHFLVQVLFCLFAEDVGLLDKGLFTDLVNLSTRRPDEFTIQVNGLFQAMRAGGIFALREVDRFNGGLFEHIDVIELTKTELQRLADIAGFDWSNVEPAIFGTLFERSLDPSKRKELGAHYTPRADIERVIKPVIIDPLRRQWAEVRIRALAVKAKWQDAASRSAATRFEQAFQRILTDFQRELSEIQILDPACGSGNFLYVTLVELEKLEKEVSQFGALNGISYMLPMVRPTQLHGIEINPFARELAQVVVWIGYLQWMRANGFHPDRNPVLHPLETISLRDALVEASDTGAPIEAQWPEATYIIGNPPFLGAKQMREHIGDAATNALHSVYGNRLPPFSDLVCYFFEKARAEIENGNARAAGLLATNSIRGGTNRTVLDRIKISGDIFMAWDDEPWVQDGAAVRISLIGFDDGTEEDRFLDSIPVTSITSALTSDIDLSRAEHLDENAGLCYLGVQFSGPFDMSHQQAQAMLALPLNPNGRPNSDVLRPVANGVDIARRWRDRWVVDFGVNRSEIDAALYQAPFKYLQTHVRPMRASSRSQARDQRWWLPIWSRPEMRSKIGQQLRYLTTPTVAKHRLFTWLSPNVLPSHALVVFARQDDYFFGVLQSRAHELWSLRMGTWLGKGNDPRYTPTTCFETFPLPWSPGQEPWRDAQLHAIANAARELNEKRRQYLEPPDASEAELKKRTLTNLYNERPAWLIHAHAALDRAIWAAYGWKDTDPSTVADEVILTRLLALNHERSQPDLSWTALGDTAGLEAGPAE